MRRLLPALAAFALVIAGVGGGLVLLTSRDGANIASTTGSTPTASGAGPNGLAAGNVVVDYSASADRAAIDALAAELGAVDSLATRASGQALVSHHVRAQAGIVATDGSDRLVLASATDPALANFVRDHLGRGATK